VSCGFSRIRLGNEDSLQDLFAFKIGERVQTKTSKRAGFIVSGDCYQSTGRPDQIFYRLKIQDGTVWNLRQEDIEPVPIEEAS
jgi:hypothetical protein